MSGVSMIIAWHMNDKGVVCTYDDTFACKV